MRLIAQAPRTPAAMRRLGLAWERAGLSTGFGPTMGALHEGHAALVRRARRENDRVVVSIFVNPLQFGPGEDFRRYPRPLRRDARLCRSLGVDALYLPRPAAMYPPGFCTGVEVGGLSGRLCGEFRPGHFRGVATVVLKLLEAVRPARAYFGEKDYQQLAVVSRLASDLDLPARIVGCPTVRAPDGLALSSRNAYLLPEERRLAAGLHEALEAGRRLAAPPGGRRAPAGVAGPATPAAVERRVAGLLRAIPGMSVEYVRVADARTLEPPARLRGGLRLLAAVRLGRARLIDNLPLFCED